MISHRSYAYLSSIIKEKKSDGQAAGLETLILCNCVFLALFLSHESQWIVTMEGIRLELP